jgi:DNA mismatch repair protein mutL
MISVLDKNTIDKIAAGEVVERPSSIVKELVENAIDSGASAISVEIKDGGISLVRVTDNGGGINKDEIKTAFLRHATSKITKAKDLFNIHTLGFRGEALSSISGIAKCEVISKPSAQLTGVRYVIEGGYEVSFEDVGAPVGTTMIVRDVFFNTPARRKFLKSVTTETAYITDLMEKFMLCNLDVSIRYIVNNQTRLQSSGNGDLKEVIYQIYGREVHKALVEVDHKADDISIKGFIAKPEISRSNRNQLIYFVNGRYVKDKHIIKAIEDGYADRMMQHKYPFAVLMIEINTEIVDVNVHPSKMEIRFSEESYIYEKVKEAIESSLKKAYMIREAKIDEEKKSSLKRSFERLPEPFEKNKLSLLNKDENRSQITAKETETKEEFLKDLPQIDLSEKTNYPQDKIQIDPEIFRYNVNHLLERTLLSDSGKNSEFIEKYEDKKEPSFEQLDFMDKKASKKRNIIGQIFDTYWIVEFDKSMYIIDQHAAHEKVLYERFLKQLDNEEIASQIISPAGVISLSSIEADAVEKHLASLRKLGFEIEHFGGREYSISAIPTILPSIDKEVWLKELITELLEVDSAKNTESILEKIASMSCKAAIKGKQRISYEEAKILIDELLELDNPYNCPHGRPTVIQMTKTEIEKKFKRII